MRKILLIIAISLLTIPIFSQGGMGWVQSRVKNQFRDSVYFYKDANFNAPVRIGVGNLRIGGVAITPDGTEINILNGLLSNTTELNRLVGVTANVQTQLDGKAPLASPNFTTAVRLAGDSLLPKTRVVALADEAVETRVASARNLGDYAFLKSTADAPGGAMTYEGVVNYVAANGGGGGGGYEWTSFIVGTTAGAPTNGDTAITISQMAGDRIKVYRGTTADLHYQHPNETATNTVTGYRYNGSGQIVVRPAWATGDRAYIEAVPSAVTTKITLSGGSISSLLTGLRAAWRMDEPAGTTVLDALGNFPGVTNALVNQDGVFGRSHSYTRASSQMATFGADVGDLGTSDFSYFCRIYVPTLVNDYCGVLEMQSNLVSFYLAVDVDNHLRAVITFDDTNYINVVSNSSIVAGQWYNVAMVYDRDGYASMYVGASQQSDLESISSHSAVNVQSNLDFRIGRGGTSAWYYDGRIDDVYLWTKALTQPEITALETSTYPF